MASYNPRNFNLDQFMNNLYQLPNLDTQFKFLGDQFECTNVRERATEGIHPCCNCPSPTSTRRPGCTANQWDLQESRSIHQSGLLHGEINHFKEWWLKMKTWLNINQPTIPPKFYDTVHSSGTLPYETKGRNVLRSKAWERTNLHLVWAWSRHSETVPSNSKTRLG